MQINFTVVGAHHRSGTGRESGRPYSFTEVEGVIPSVDKNGQPQNRVCKVLLDGNVVLQTGPHILTFRPDVTRGGELVMRAHSLTVVEKPGKA